MFDEVVKYSYIEDSEDEADPDVEYIQEIAEKETRQELMRLSPGVPGAVRVKVEPETPPAPPPSSRSKKLVKELQEVASQSPFTYRGRISSGNSALDCWTAFLTVPENRKWVAPVNFFPHVRQLSTAVIGF